MSHHAWLDQMVFRFAFLLGYRLLQVRRGLRWKLPLKSTTQSHSLWEVGGTRLSGFHACPNDGQTKAQTFFLIYLLLLCMYVHD